MNKQLDFIDVEERILGGGKRYIPRFEQKGSFFRMKYCGNVAVYNGDIYNADTVILDNLSLVVFGYIVKETMTNPFFTLPDEVREAMEVLHKTDRKKAVDEAEGVIHRWFNSVTNLDTGLYLHGRGFNDVAYGTVFKKKETTATQTITTHLLGSLYSRRYGEYLLDDGYTVVVGEPVFNDSYWAYKNPAPNVDIREQKISNYLSVEKKRFKDLLGNKIVVSDDWMVDFDNKIIRLYKDLDEKEIKLAILQGAIVIDSRKFDTQYQPLPIIRGRESAAYMCDRFYYECVKQNPESVIAEDEVTFTVVRETKEEIEEDVKEEVKTDDKEDTIGMTITLNAQKARNGEYDLGKMFGITFNAPSPNRDFLKNVSITKQHLQLCNKIIQACYRIKKRESEGVTDIIGADFVNVNFIGEPGTGKSFSLKIVSAILGVPLFIETFSGDSDTDKFQGTNTISKGAPTFEWTAVPTAHRDGGFCALEEVNQMRPDKTMSMSQALVDPFLLKVDNTMDVYRNPYTFYVNLFNVGTEGSKPFNEAYINRFGFTYDFCDNGNDKEQLKLMLGYDVTDGDEVKEMRFEPRKLTDRDFEMAVDLKNRVINYLTGDTVARDEEAKTISKRQCKEFLIEVQNGLDHKASAIGTFVNTLKCVDRELAKDVYNNVIECYPF